MASNPKDDVKYIASQPTIDILKWFMKVDAGTIFKHKNTESYLRVIHPDFTGAKCVDSKGNRQHYGIVDLTENYEIIDTEMVEILFKNERPAKKPT